MKILETKNYDQFILDNVNRPIGEKKVNNMIRSIQEIGYIKANPIIVSEDNVVIDGQHRLAACKELKIAVPYVKQPTNGEHREIMVLLNQKQSNWQQIDYIRYYANLNVGDYKELYGFIQANIGGKITISILLNVFCQNRSNISKGVFVKRKSDYNRDLTLLVEYMLKFTYAKKDAFVRAAMKLFNSPRYNHKEHFAKILRLRYQMYECAKEPQYLNLFTEILNKGVSKNIFYL